MQSNKNKKWRKVLTRLFWCIVPKLVALLDDILNLIS